MTSYTNGDTKPMLDGMIATGDTGRLDHVGRLFIEGRADTMIVSGGENVFPEEVEAALLSLPGLADAKVVGIEDEEFGQRLRAFVVASGEPRPTEDEIATHIRTELSRSRVPRDLIYVDELPRTATGKVTRQTIDELTARYAQASSAAVEA
jgi:fatty-acyl-CoA synthase